MSLLSYVRHYATKLTPQSQPIPGSAQVPNSAGGYGFALDAWARLDRFLVLGSEGGSYYASERQLTVDNAQAVRAALALDGLRVVARIVELSIAGRAPKNDPAIFALAMALKLGDLETRRAAAAAVPQVCRIGTHLFQLVEALEAFGGWGRVTTRAVAGWYHGQSADALALNLFKYQQRGGWSHDDVLSLSHAGSGAPTDAHAALYRYVVCEGSLQARHVTRVKHGRVVNEADYPQLAREALPRLVEGVERVRAAGSAKEAAQVVAAYGLPREVVPTEHLSSREVWEALLLAGRGMPLHAMVRNLGKMSAVGLLRPLSGGPMPAALRAVVERLSDVDAIRKARLHPMSILLAQRTYAQGHGSKGKLAWPVVPQVVDALDDAFYRAFAAVEPTNLRMLLALDVSGSMASGSVAGSGLTPREASAALALVTARTEPHHHIVGFTAGVTGEYRYGAGGSMHGGYASSLSSVGISARMRLRDAVAAVSHLPMGGTDCALPMLYAPAKTIPVDVFVVYTDSETWANPKMHPVQALRLYREATGIPAKLIVVGLVANAFTIADPNDAGMLDVVGFDSAVPDLMASFACA